MNYKTKANKISKKNTNFGNSLNNLKKINFDNIWTGSAKDTLIGSLNETIDELYITHAAINLYVSALQELDKYKTKKEKITSLRNQYNSLANTKENKNTKNNLSSQISALVSENREIRKSIETKISNICSDTIDLSIDSIPTITLPSTENATYVVDIQKLLMQFENGTLKKIPDGESLYNYFSEDEVKQLLTQVQNKYKGRYLALNSALGIVDLAASKNLKLDYDWGGGHSEYTSMKEVATGTDCSAFVSWAINQGDPDNFATRTTSGLINVGTTIEYNDAQPGDILVYRKNDKGHVVMIVENNPEKQEFIVVEAYGQNDGVILKTRDYSSLKNGSYKAKDLSEIYKAQGEE